MATETTQQIVREAPEIEALKIQLMEQAQKLALSDTLSKELARPEAQYRIAGFDPTQEQALKAAERQGIGAFAPYLQTASQALSGGYGLTGEAADILRGADVRNQFTDAQRAMQQAGGATAQMTAGLPLLGQAQQLAGAAAGAPGFAQGIGAGYTAAEQARMAAAQPGFRQGTEALYAAAQQAQNASRLGAAPTIGQVPGVTAQGIEAAQTRFDPGLQRFQMGPTQQVGAQQLGIGSLQAAQTGFRPDLQAFQMGPAERVAAGTITAPGAMSQYMSPYMQNVVDVQLREAQRQDDIAKQARAAQAVRSGAFGGTREGVVEAEAGRNLARLQSDIQAQGLQQAFQQAQQQFNVEEQARLAAQQANQQAGLTVGAQNLASQLGVQQLGTQTGLQTALANLSNEQQARVQQEANRLQAGGMNQQAALQAALANQQTQFGAAQQNLQAALGVQQLGTQTGLQTALANLSNEQQARVQSEANRLQAQGMNQEQAMRAALSNQQMMGQYGITGAQLGMQGAEMLRQAGMGEIGVAGQLAGLGQQAAQQLGQAAALQTGTTAQQAGLQQQAANIYGQLAGQTANIYGQQAQQLQGLGQGIGALAGQQFGIGQQIAGGLGALGQQMGGLGIQAGALGQTAQGMSQADINFLYNIGQSRQAQQQQVYDAQRASAMQQMYVPYQQAAFLSDIYRGAPSSQMATTAASTPQPSPFQQVAGTALGALATGAAVKKLF
jgi:hypothetical protein